MSRLRVFTSNRLEILADRLAEAVRRPLSSPLEPEVVVVPSQGMGRWVSQEMARRLGAWMNGRTVLPNAYLDELFRSLPGVAQRAAWSPEALRWRVMRLLPECLGRPGFEPLCRYLAGEERQFRVYQLAGKIAEVFDGYALFRPALVLGWEGGSGVEEGGWQVELWRLLAAEDPSHRAALRREFLGRVRGLGDGMQAGSLPERVSVFGASGLPPFHLETFAALSERTAVDLYLVSPCREYWADIVPTRVVARRTRSAGREDHHWEEGNRLLASLGKTGRDFFGQVQDLPAEPQEDWADPGERSLLSCLQSDILNLRDRGASARRPLDPADDSLRLHSCHSPLREVEVLRDCLLDLFERHRELEPHHVVVMTPDPERYSPGVEAVFEGPGVPRIPFAIADRTARGASPLAAVFLRAIGLVGGRLGAAQVLDLLGTPAVCRRFGLTDADVQRAHVWVRETRVRWGVDGEDRRALGLPAFEENTWRAGLDRLLLGYALPGGGERFFEGVLPYDDLEGTDAAETLGRLAEFADRLFVRVRALEAPRDLQAWAADLGDFFDALFEAGAGEEREERLVRRALSGLRETRELAGYGGTVEWEVVRSTVAASMEAEPQGGGFLAGGVTFCALRPLRSIPFPVVCLLGMDDGAFPRSTRAVGFDLAAANPKPGDRSPRHEDRYAFLEALLAAGRHLHVSYVGQSLRDGSDIPPSVVVSELLDAVEEGFSPAGGEPPEEGWARRHLIVRHRLQAFSPAYFRPPGPLPPSLFSYSAEDALASRHLAAGATKRRRGLFLRCLPDPAEELRRVELGELVRFLGNPARHLFAVRLGLRLEDEAAVVEEREPFDIEGLERYGLEQRLVAAGLQGRELAGVLSEARARGLLPHGGPGEGAFGDLRNEVEAFLAALSPHLAGRPLEPLSFEREVSCAFGLFTLRGRLEGLWSDRLLRFRPATVKPRDRLGLWVHHLALNLQAGEGLPRASTLVGKGEVLALPPMAGAEAHLGALLEIYWEGLSRLVPFFPRASWAYAARRWGRGDGDRRSALKAARLEWEGGFRRDPEAGDPHFAQAFGCEDPLGGEFEELAGRVFAPLISLAEAQGTEAGA